MRIAALATLTVSIPLISFIWSLYPSIPSPFSYAKLLIQPGLMDPRGLRKTDTLTIMNIYQFY
jgi:hypothetical protein